MQRIQKSYTQPIQINIRLEQATLESLKQEAKEKGIGCTYLINQVLEQYLKQIKETI
jgi:predicted DNA binding CopG/RHH family protein